LKILICGLGSIGQRHVRNIRLLFGKKYDIIAYRKIGSQKHITDKLNLDKKTNIEEKFDIEVFDDLDHALSEKPEMCFICNPTSLHLETAIKAAAAGCHLFIEKPVSHNLKNINQLTSFVDEKNLITMVGYQLHFHPFLLQVKELILSKQMGKIISVHIEAGEYLPSWHPYEDYRKSYASLSELGGGVLLSFIHEINYLCWIFGKPKSLYAVGGKFSSLEINVEDIVNVLMTYNNGENEIPVFLHLDYIQNPPSKQLTIICNKGKIFVDLIKAKLQVNNLDGETIIDKKLKDFNRNQMFIDEIKHFFSCYKKECKTEVPLKDGINDLIIAESIRNSMTDNTLIYL